MRVARGVRSGAAVWAAVGAAALLLPSCKSRDLDAHHGPEALKKAEEPDPFAIPRDVVWAASSHLRIVDVALGQVVAGVDLGRPVTAIEFTSDGGRVFVAASDGVREIDVETHKVKNELTRRPARSIQRSADDARLYVLEHDVEAAPDGTRESPRFDLVTIELDRGTELGREEVGPRILRAVPASGPGRFHLVITEAGEVRLGKHPERLSGGKPIATIEKPPEPPGTPPPDLVLTADRKKAYVPIQGTPSRVLEIDLESGASRPISLGGPALLRGLGLTPDGKTLVVNTLRELMVIDVETGERRGSIELGTPHHGAAVAADGRRVYLAQALDGAAGAIGIVRLQPSLKIQGKIHLDDISPSVIAVRPRAEYAVR